MNRYQKTAFFVLSTLFFAGTLFLLPPLAAPVSAAEDPEEIEDDIEKIEKKLKDAAKKEAVLEQNLTQISSTLSSTQAVIARVQNLLNQTAQTIEQKESEIAQLEQELVLQRSVLKGLVREMYYTGKVPLVEVMLTEDAVMSLFNVEDGLFSTQEKMQQMMDEIKAMKDKVSNERTVLEDTKKDHETLLTIQNKQKQVLVVEQQEVKEDLADQEATIAELQEKLQDLKGDLSALTGKSYDAKDIREAVEYASDKTGVPKGVLYGFLKMETNLGANTGQCTYDQVKKDALSRYYNKNKKKYKNSIALLERRHDIFMDIVDELGYSKNKKVSCTPRSYVGQGGAMGVAQFMADVWRGYEAQIASQTGHKDPDPWNLTDGVMALALKVKKAGATSDSSSAIRKASIAYLGAFNQGYYNGIVYWSKNYKKLFS